MAVVPDCHFPFVDRKAYNLMLSVFSDFKPTHIVFLGDFGDFYSVSSYAKDPSRYLLLKDEIEITNGELSKYDKLFPHAKKIFIEGNHEYRLARYIEERCPELFGTVTVNGLFKFTQRSWQYVEWGGHCKLGKLIFTHRGATGKNAAYKAITLYEYSVCFGDLHRIEEAVKVNSLGEAHVGFIPGWLGDVKTAAQYIKRPFIDWQLGFATVYIEESGDFFHQIHPIVNQKTMFNGRVYRA